MVYHLRFWQHFKVEPHFKQHAIDLSHSYTTGMFSAVVLVQDTLAASITIQDTLSFSLIILPLEVGDSEMLKDMYLRKKVIYSIISSSK